MDPRTSLNQIKNTWIPPRELQRARPREVRLTFGGKTLVGLAIALLLGGIFGGLALYTKASRDRLERTRLLESGIDAEAWIIRRWTAGSDPVRYWAEYSYQVNNQTYTGRLPMRRDTWLKLENAETLNIKYLPQNPQSHMVRGLEPKLLPPWVSILVAGVLFFVAWLVTRILALQRRLLAEGRPAPGIVTEVARTRNGKVAHYAFMAMSGKVINGKLRPRKNPPAVGTVLSVIYEPDHETHNSTFPLPLVKTRY